MYQFKCGLWHQYGHIMILLSVIYIEMFHVTDGAEACPMGTEYHSSQRCYLTNHN